MATKEKQLVIAKASHALASPRKTNLVLKAIVGRPALLAIKQLAVIPKRAGKPVVQLIKQAIGNAVSQHNASPESLIIDSAFATKGRTLKRAHIGGRGRTKPYERITSHLTLTVRIPAVKVSAPKVETKKVETKAVSEVKAETKKVSAPKKVVKTTKKSK